MVEFIKTCDQYPRRFNFVDVVDVYRSAGARVYVFLWETLSQMQFFLQNVPNEIFKIFKMFENNVKFTRAACWINSKITNRDKNTTPIKFLFCHYYWALLWCHYWKSLESGAHLPKTLLYLLQWNTFNFILKTLPLVKIFKFLCWLFGHVKKRLD